MGELLRLGVVSDIHLHEPGDENYFLRALEYFRERKVDGVVVAGDIADDGQVAQLQRAADTFWKVFPNDRAPDGRKVERLFVYGNHCVRCGQGPSSIKYDRAKAWKTVFKEDFAPIWKKTVRGIPVFGAHWLDEDGGNPVEAFMKEHAGEIDPDLPFVYIQHDHPKDTCIGPWAWGHDDGRATRALSPFPNAVVFSGHSHHTVADDRSVWQGAFTSINAGAERYLSCAYALRENVNGNECGYRGENRRHRMRCFNAPDCGRQGQVVTFYRDRLTVERRDFYYNESLGADIVVPFPASEKNGFSFAARAKTRSAPAFAAGSSVAVTQVAPKDEGDFHHIELAFPAATAVDRCRVMEYEVTAVLVEDDVELIQAQRRMLAPDHHRPEGRLLEEVGFTFAKEDLPVLGHYRFEVRALECFGKKSDAISSPVVKV